MISRRPGTCGIVERRAAITSGLVPTAQAAAAAASALATLKSPMSGSVTACCAVPMTSVQRLPRGVNCTFAARTSAVAASPKRTMRGAAGSAAHAGSSAFTTAVPSSASSATSTAFAARYASIVTW